MANVTGRPRAERQRKSATEHKLTRHDQQRIWEAAQEVPLTMDEVKSYVIRVYRVKLLRLPSNLVSAVVADFNGMRDARLEKERIAEEQEEQRRQEAIQRRKEEQLRRRDKIREKRAARKGRVNKSKKAAKARRMADKRNRRKHGGDGYARD